jgi:hypothetical protein
VVALAALGLASCAFVVLRLLETWRVTPSNASHHVTILGERLAYPTANLAALVVLVLAALGVAATALTAGGAVGELRADRRFRRRVAPRAAPGPGGALVLPDERPRAFCAGFLRPRVYVSAGAVALLDADALTAVLRHERHHARHRDPLRLAAGRVAVRALFFVPGLRELFRRQQGLAELDADASALAGGEASREALARAMLGLTGDALTGLDPARIDQLAGEASGAGVPIALCAAAATVIAAVVAAAIVAGNLAVGSASLAPPFLSGQPCVVVLALIPLALGGAAVGVARGAAPRRGSRRPARRCRVR